MIDGDVGRTLGHILEHELRIDRAVVSIDGIQLKEFDFVDIGETIRPAGVVPVVIKSLLFSGVPVHASRQSVPAYKPMTERTIQ
jgi:ethanolamine utilization protein EutA